MQGSALLVSQVVTLIVRDQIDDGPVGQGRGFIEDEAPLLDARSERAHGATVRVFALPGKATRIDSDHWRQPLNGKPESRSCARV